MNFDLLEHLQQEVNQLHTKEEKMDFIERIRFALMADQYDYENYYADKDLSESEFYSILGLLYQLDNLAMLAGFINKHKSMLLKEPFESLAPLMDETALANERFQTRVQGLCAIEN